jgi:hypothetical protein
VPSGGPPPGERTHTGEPEGVPEPQENPLVEEPPLQQKVGGWGTNQGMGDGQEDGCKTNENNSGSKNLIHKLTFNFYLVDMGWGSHIEFGSICS